MKSNKKKRNTNKSINMKILIAFILGAIISVASSYVIAETLINSKDVSYVDNAKLGATNVQAAIDGTCTKFSNDLATLQTTIINKIYPVGSIYISYNNTNPGTLFGGTWENYGNGRVLKGINSGTAGTTGGSSTVTLSMSNIPAHTHTYDKANANTDSHILTIEETPIGLVRYASVADEAWSLGTWGVHGGGFAAVIDNKEGYGVYGKGHTHPISTLSTNSGSAGSSNPTAISVQDPYITVYMWRRTK